MAGKVCLWIGGAILCLAVLFSLSCLVFGDWLKIDEKNATGEVVQVIFGKIARGGNPVTMIVFKSENGEFFALGTQGHNQDFKVGKKMEITFSRSDFTVYSEEKEETVNPDGSKTVTVRKTRWLTILKYKVLN